MIVVLALGSLFIRANAFSRAAQLHSDHPSKRVSVPLHLHNRGLHRALYMCMNVNQRISRRQIKWVFCLSFAKSVTKVMLLRPTFGHRPELLSSLFISTRFWGNKSGSWTPESAPDCLIQV